MTPSDSDTGLLRRIAAGDKVAVRDLIDRFGGLVWSLTRTFARDTADAEDAVQDVFIHLWRKAHMYDERFGSESQFVAVLARRRLIDRYRSESARRRTTAIAVERQSRVAEPAPVDRATAGHDARRALDHLRELGETERMVLVLSIAKGLTHDQIARHLSMPIGSVKTHLYRGLAALRARLARADGPLDAAGASPAQTRPVRDLGCFLWGLLG